LVKFQAALLIYDLGLIGDDKELSNAIWRRFFSAEEPDFEKIEILVSYIRRNMAYLDSLSFDDLIIKSKVNWLQL
jgi:cytochrome b pre-mRNA-processing protein 3